ncbi:uncharacterized protein LOC133804569 [Humulus lupulus]|uniref:uncharacterized protein LOC133804569 n=1 Tax=Humulus lupulus TaxID=3486 RepID=UPI002B410A72|nr:uncharacterized protein LOC133804569 [Humulus lupulus]
MDLSQEVDDYIRGSIDYTVGLPVSTCTLEMKLRAVEEAQSQLRDRYLLLQSRLKEKDQTIERVRAESNMNAIALKKFVEENQKLASECNRLLSQCNKWERECSLYDRDREVLMDFGNEADQRAKEAEVRSQELEDKMKGLSEELQFYKCQYDKPVVDSSLDATTQDTLLESVLGTLINEENAVSGRAFLEANSSDESCQKLLEMWNSLKPSAQKVLSIAAKLKVLENDKEHLRINLCKAEDEVKVLFEENSLLEEDNQKLISLYRQERNHNGSSGKHGSASAKSNKRKSSSPIEKKIDFTDVDTARLPLSPLRCNSPESRMLKK